VQTDRKNRSALPFRFLAFTSLIAPLPVLAYLGFYVRYSADDYCHAAAALSHGVFGCVRYWYETWSGRFAFHLIDGYSALLDPRLHRALTALLLGLWLLALHLFFRPITLSTARPRLTSWSAPRKLIQLV
jgi:hypothetical protein